MRSVFQLTLLLPTTVLTILWIYTALRGEKKFQNLIAAMDEKQYPLGELFFIGFQLLEWFHFNIKSEKNRKKVKEMAEIYGKKYAEYYFYLQVGGQVTYIFTTVTVVFLLAILADNSMALLFGVVLAVLLAWYISETFKDKLVARREELLLEFPQVLSKITLLVNSGMMLREAWKKVAKSGSGVLYQEMLVTSEALENGTSEREAYYGFAERCALKEMRKFSSLVIQSLTKGSAELTLFLRDMSDEMWEMKKNLVKRKAEQANSKLLMPTVMIFAGILIMIMAPMLGGL